MKVEEYQTKDGGKVKVGSMVKKSKANVCSMAPALLVFISGS